MWEYLYETWLIHKAEDEEFMVNQMNRFGLEGWEVISVIQNNKNTSGNYTQFLVFFKRYNPDLAAQEAEARLNAA